MQAEIKEQLCETSYSSILRFKQMFELASRHLTETNSEAEIITYDDRVERQMEVLVDMKTVPDIKIDTEDETAQEFYKQKDDKSRSSEENTDNEDATMRDELCPRS